MSPLMMGCDHLAFEFESAPASRAPDRPGLASTCASATGSPSGPTTTPASFEASARTTRANWNQFKRDVQKGLDRLEAGGQNAVDRMRAAGIEIKAEIEDAVD